uniref:Helicase C-terminal domain-containing protein n=1 Tax=Gongylonema pulchrum TaxID=637853 RepID=A0A183D125_9BILA
LKKHRFFRVLIFAEKKSDVDNIYEYLLVKGVDVASLHGGKDQRDRHTGVDAFRRGEKDVLVATDVASKGLDFENIRHVINYDMPEDIENYEAGQELPLFLRDMGGAEVAQSDDSTNADDKGCAYCSGLGHRITNCPKLENVQTKVSFSDLCLFHYDLPNCRFWNPRYFCDAVRQELSYSANLHCPA